MVTEEKIQSMFLFAETGKESDLQKLLKKTKGVVHATDKDGRTVRRIFSEFSLNFLNNIDMYRLFIVLYLMVLNHLLSICY